jgi:hypothetical protein
MLILTRLIQKIILIILIKIIKITLLKTRSLMSSDIKKTRLSALFQDDSEENFSAKKGYRMNYEDFLLMQQIQENKRVRKRDVALTLLLVTVFLGVTIHYGPLLVVHCQTRYLEASRKLLEVESRKKTETAARAIYHGADALGIAGSRAFQKSPVVARWNSDITEMIKHASSIFCQSQSQLRKP